MARPDALLMLPDILIHRKQVPHARFFSPDASEAAAEALLEISRRPTPARQPVETLAVNQNRGWTSMRRACQARGAMQYESDRFNRLQGVEMFVE